MAGSDSGCVSASADDKARGASWRGHLKVHPAAELFPLMSEPELRELGEDIKANGLRLSIVLYKGKLLDGRNRLDAMESVGIKFGFHRDAYTKEFYYVHACDDSDVFDSGAGLINHFDGDPYDFVLSANLHRRHLTSEQKRELIAKVLKAKPETSNAAVAKQTKTTDKTVAKVRRKLESTSEIPKLEKTVGKDGKARPKTKKTKKPAGAPKTKEPEPEPEHGVTASPEISIEQRRTENAQLDQPAETAVDEIYRRVGYVANTIRRQLEGLSYSDVERFFATLRDRVDALELALRAEVAR